MGERRTLVDGLDTIEPGDRTVEEQFVYGKKAPAERAVGSHAPGEIFRGARTHPPARSDPQWPACLHDLRPR